MTIVNEEWEDILKKSTDIDEHSVCVNKYAIEAISRLLKKKEFQHGSLKWVCRNLLNSVKVK